MNAITLSNLYVGIDRKVHEFTDIKLTKSKQSHGKGHHVLKTQWYILMPGWVVGLLWMGL